MVTIVAGYIALASAKKVATITVNELYKMSSVIVTARVDSISTIADLKVATAKVMQTFKGHPGETVSFVAGKTWTCDISNAKKGEKVLLYLSAVSRRDSVKGIADQYMRQGTQLYMISHSGRGRLPLIEDKKGYWISAQFDESQLGDESWSINIDLNLPDGKLVKRKLKDKGMITLTNILSYQ